jgi:AAA+ ATPase superfamily predicted ATPase
MYGRRRIGKSTLIQEFIKNKEHTFYFEGIESGNTKAQILHFTSALRKMVNDPVLDSVMFSNWDQVFTYFTDRVVNSLPEKKLILVLDEIQWLAAGRKTLIAMIKYYWDNFWKGKNIKLILCGSIASFMVENIIKI